MTFSFLILLKPTGNPTTIKNLRKEGVDVIHIELTEFCKAGGSPRALHYRLEGNEEVFIRKESKRRENTIKYPRPIDCN